MYRIRAVDSPFRRKEKKLKLWNAVFSANDSLDFCLFYRWYKSEFKQLGPFGLETAERLSIHN